MLRLAFQRWERAKDLKFSLECAREEKKSFVPGKERQCIFNPFIIRICREEFQTNIIKPFEIEVTVLRAP